MRKILLTDLDGVILDWSGRFDEYLKMYSPTSKSMDPTVFEQTDDIAQHMIAFNRSAWIGYLEPLRDAREILKNFKQDGWQIFACTAMGYDPYSCSLRKKNIENLFPNIFDRVEMTAFGEPKHNWLSQWRNSGAVWVEDKWANAIAGADFGLKTFLMKHSYNTKHDYQGVEKVDNWTQIYNKVTQ